MKQRWQTTSEREIYSSEVGYYAIPILDVTNLRVHVSNTLTVHYTTDIMPGYNARNIVDRTALKQCIP
jgi:hypothetical protein